MPNGQKAVELILARNLLSTITTPGFLIDEAGVLVFYNEAAGVLLGRRFEEAGKMAPEEWGATWGPFGRRGKPIPLEELPLTVALRQGRPAYSTFTIKSLSGEEHEIEAAALPIVNTEGTAGAMVFFWTAEEGS